MKVKVKCHIPTERHSPQQVVIFLFKSTKSGDFYTGISSWMALTNQPYTGFVLNWENKSFRIVFHWYLTATNVRNTQTIFLIKYKLTTCFLLLLGLQFQKLGCFQKRFDAHFCPVGRTVAQFFKRKAIKQMQYAPGHDRERGSQSKAGKRVIGYPLSRNSTTYIGELQTRWRSK